MNKLYVAMGAVVVGGLVVWLVLGQDPIESPPRVKTSTSDSASSAETNLAAVEAIEAEEPKVDNRAKARGSIRWVNCKPEGVGAEPLTDAEMQPTFEALEVMENCLADTYVADPSHVAINVSVVFYLAPDGSINETGCGADVRSEDAWSTLQGCVLDYWTVNPPTVAATDEKTFTCRYWWSREELLGGLRVASPLMLDVWFSKRPIGGVFLDGVSSAGSKR